MYLYEPIVDQAPHTPMQILLKNIGYRPVIFAMSTGENGQKINMTHI